MEITKEINPLPVQTGALHQEDRSHLLREFLSLTLEASPPNDSTKEQQMAQILGNLVKAKFLSAEDSYRLKDRLLDHDRLDQAIDHRIEIILKKRCLI